MPFQPGVSGNPNGTSKLRRFYETLDKIITQDESKKTPRLHAAVEKLLDAARDGEEWALQMLADRLDGKPHQSVAATLDGKVTVEVVKFTDADDSHTR